MIGVARELEFCIWDWKGGEFGEGRVRVFVTLFVQFRLCSEFRQMSLKKSIFNALAEKHQDEIYEYARYMLRDAQEAEDISQEVLLRLWDRVGTFKALSARSWIKRVTRNLCIDVIRKREATTNKELSMEAVDVENFSNASWESPERETEASELSASIREAIALLPEHLRSIFVLYELQGHNHRQIGQILNIPANTSKVYLMRARLDLRVLLKNHRPQHER